MGNSLAMLSVTYYHILKEEERYLQRLRKQKNKEVKITKFSIGSKNQTDIPFKRLE